MRRLIAIAIATWSTGCASTSPCLLLPTDAGVEAHHAAGLIEAHPIPPDRNILSVPLGHTEALSYHLVQIRSRESPHVHAHHDLVVTLLRGRGELHDGSRVLQMQAGDTAVVPRGQTHYFVNLEDNPAAAFVTFAPPFDGTDNLPIE